MFTEFFVHKKNITPHLIVVEIYSDCSNSLENDKHHFLSLLEENHNLGDLMPSSFFRD
jgi:hypothetical protein